ncbi:MAG: hypothetical protein HY836_01445 [Aquabacterium sp.]|uniref:hypothetical protein n=1 Tax=Aquabacterium sp. TaxID=1872578 RepID=UPI0025BB1DE7|nr:hypothetical protein [Aquabacterium sp.]MBI5924240.1 hypothetical protein [Aquabacterium sp.]
MHCVDVAGGKLVRRVVSYGLWFAVAFGVVGCSLFGKKEEPAGVSARPVAPTPVPMPTTVNTSKGAIKLPVPNTPKSWADARQQAANRMVLANPDVVYTGKPPDILLAIPVLTIELHADGGIKNIAVMRYPSQARETVAMAMAAVRRAAPFGDVSRLPKPWKFNETFLFNADKKFKPMTLDQR